jgi:transcriptional regulator with XRE-family HTH domain
MTTDRNLTNLAFSAKAKRKAKMWSQEYLAEKVGVSVGTISKFESGKRIAEETIDKVLLHLGMMHALTNVREDREKTGFKSLSLEELRTAIQACKDFMRDGTKEEQIEMMGYKNLAQNEMKIRLRQFFK